ncbi:LamG domain-containing protein [Micromonospora sp. DR5-3]|uniref:LamG domain-containing protein n=1 Tax=Micromonospora sp. DR5-3 TaxID=2992129 RepID=UPI00222F3C77|nr:LamG domain-containing protein [Micromonospora sp. DR5-3]MCW3819642.1 LamG domain-containing protein [Micromonospora sp. DR5-3]
MAAARLQKSSVEVANLTTETRIVHAQPNGTLTAQLSPGVTRVRQGGTWVGVDTSLVRRPDGSIAPRAAAVDLAFSGGGGKAPLVRYARAGKGITLVWPGPLPAPTLSGSTATYAEVLPGVDLVLRAETDGYTHHLVVKNAKAAANPAVRRVRLGLRADGLRVRASDQGALEARDAANKLVFQAPPSQMWDSGRPAKTAAVDVSVKGGNLTLVPDRKLLADPATRFPVIVDPTWGTAARTGWAKVFSGMPNQSYWFGGMDGGEAKVGQCWPSEACNGIAAARTYFQYDTGFLAGKRILTAVLNTTITYSPSCGWRDLQLFIANGPIGGGTTWNNAPPGAGLQIKPADVSYVGCAGYKPLGFDTFGNIRAGGVSTYFIKAVDEGDGYAWRKLDPNATNLVVNYNTAPNAPYDLNTDARLAAPCRWCGGTSYVGDDWIRLQTRLSDPDNDQVRPIWDIYGGPQPEHRDWGPTQSSGAFFSTDLDLRGRDGQKISWTVWASDGTDGGPSRSGPGPFIVDRVGVSKPPGVSASMYKEDNRWHGGIGVADQFTFDAAGVADIDHYRYGWQDPPSTKVNADALGGKATVTIAPPGDGPRDLYVQSVDRAGHRSPTRVYHFYVRAGNGPYGQWALEGNANDDAFLGDHDGTLSGNATYAAGAVGTGLRLDGTGAHMTAPNTVRTDTSFSVSAWAKLDTGGSARTVVSQDGTRFAGFNLWYRPENGGKWVFGMAKSDASTQGTDMAWSAAPAQLGVWTHLAGVYDAPNKKLKLYVNGVLSGTATRTVTGWNAGGSVRVGQTIWDGTAVDFWPGMIDEVQVYDRTISETEVKGAVSRDNVQVGYWKFDETNGKTAVNATAGGDMAVLAEGATFAPGQGAVDGALRFDGVKGYAATNGPAFRTDQSFAVGAWVKADRIAATGTAQTFISQDGTNSSGFFLQQRGTSWLFGILDGDQAGGWSGYAASPDGSAQANAWTHVVGVYDAPAGKLRIYLNGTLAGSGAISAAWSATGPLVFGRGKYGGVETDFWPGLLDDMRAYSRVVSDEEIRGIVSRDNVSVGQWKLDGDALDGSGRGLHGTLNGNPDWVGGQTSVPDPSDLALHLNGTSGHVSAPNAVDASKSFSVAAWARLDKVGGHYGVVSQDGKTTSAFKLEAEPGGRWSFVMFTQDVNGGGQGDRATGGTAQSDVWTHLVGVYDAGNRQISLYINGVLAGSVAHATAWNHPDGGLQIGRNKWYGNPIDFFPGAIDDVAVYGRPLFADEIRAMAGRDLSLVHNWQLDEASGTTAADAVGARPGTLSPGASFVPGRIGNAVELNGSTGAVSTTGVDLRTDQSFTVAAWVYLKSKDCDLGTYWQCKADAVTVDGNWTSKFRLGHVVDSDQNMFGAWTFEMPEDDVDDAQVTMAAVSALPTDLDTWTHLVGVYDAPTKKIWLYVNGTRIGDGTVLNPWQASGGLQIGRGKVNRAETEYWPGRVDDVRMYTGALDDDRVSALYQSYPAPDGSTELPTADAGYWKLDEGAGDTAADVSGRGLTATLQGGAGAGWAGARSGAGLWLDGATGYAETAGPVVTTSASFSVTAWAHLTVSDNGNRTIAAQDGNRASSFLLQYNAGYGKWTIVIPDADQDNPTNIRLTSTSAAAVGDWTHLGLVYDASLRQLRLYVNGVLSAARTGVSILNAGGRFTIGRGKWNGQNVDFFPRGIDDVRVFSRALSDGEVRRVHDDVPANEAAFYRFDDGTARDYSSRKNDATVSGGATLVPGVSGQAGQLDGVSGAAVTTQPVVSMRDSFTVSAWAKLARKDKVYTVAGQDGDRMGGFFLQYRPTLDRWVFGAPTQDSDSAALAYADSMVPAVVDRWTHLTGVYDYSARQLRLYVNGQLANTKDNVALWPAFGGFTIGRGRYNGLPAEFFAGAIDEVRVTQGMMPDAEIAERATWPAPPARQLGRYINAAGDHYTGNTGSPVREGYRFEGTLGTPVPVQQPNTRMLYACQAGTDGFTSTDPACDGQTKLGDIGAVYTTPPTNLPTVPIYRCTTGSERFESGRPDCAGATNESLLGYALAYAPLARYHDMGHDHLSTVNGTPPGYRPDGQQGFVALTQATGTQPLMSCLDDTDHFASLDARCEGKTVVSTIGEIWSQAPPEQPSAPIYRCRFGSERFVSMQADCEGATVDQQLGYVLTAVPDLTPVFG